MGYLQLLIVADERRKPHSRHNIYEGEALKAGVRDKRWCENGGVATVQKGLGNESYAMLKKAKSLFSGGGGVRGWLFVDVQPYRSTS